LREHKQQGQQGAGQSGGEEGDKKPDPRKEQALQMARAARAWNEAHSELAAEFQKLTGIDPKDFRAVRAWQLEHGLRGDGKIGEKTLEAAKGGTADGGSEEKPDQAGAAPEGGAKSAKAAGPKNAAAKGAEPAESDGGDDLAAELVAGGDTEGEEHRAKDPEKEKEEGGKNVSEGVEHAGEAAGLEGGAGLGVRTAAQIARMPHVIALVKQHKYGEAAKYITDTLGFGDAVEVVKLVAEHLGLDLAEVLPNVTRVATVGAETADIVLAGLDFQYEGLMALAEAKERGERDNRIILYSEAWAGGFLEGEYSNAGAITDEQREAVTNGLRDGKASAGKLGEKAESIGKQLLAKYGNEGNARRALIDELLKRGGIEGIRMHQGA
jgi:hypothetical protein